MAARMAKDKAIGAAADAFAGACGLTRLATAVIVRRRLFPESDAYMMRRMALHAGWCAGVVFLLAVLAADARDGARMLAEYGAVDAPGALAWNLVVFVLPGALLVLFALALEAPMRAAGVRRVGRIGSTLLMLSGVFFAAQGVLPYDLEAPNAEASKLHVMSLSLSLLAFLPGAALCAASLRRAPGWLVLRMPGGLLAAAVLACLLFPPGVWLPAVQGEPGLAQRVLLGLYFGWFALASGVAVRVSKVVRVCERS